MSQNDGNGWADADNRASSIRPLLFSLIMLGLLLGLSLSPDVRLIGPDAAHAAPTVYYASPTGSGSACTQAAPCSLTGVQAVVRSISGTMSDDIVVNLMGGTYTLTQPWTFSPTLGDSGSNGHHIIYQANGFGTPSQAAPILSGGQTVTGWSLHDSAKNIWKANVGSLETRQLYVNGKRAFRARQNSGISGTITRMATGYVTTGTTLQSWANPTDIEFVYHDGQTNGNWLWAEPRCPVASITGNASSTTITMAQPCFTRVANDRGGYATLSLPTAIENNYKALTQPGRFYLDRAVSGSHVLYYIPRSGENLATASVIAPVLEKLVDGQGTLSTPLSYLQFKGITFSYATWLGPNSADGFAETSYNKMNNGTTEKQILGNVSFYAAHNLVFERNTFIHLGGAGLTLDNGSQNNLVSGSIFTDISGNGIQIGNVDLNASSGPGLVTDNVVRNNYIHDIGVEYPGAYGLWNANTQNTTVTHNVFAHLPRGGFASNYRYKQRPAVANGHQFTYNLVYDYMNGIRDGGGFDTNGMQNGVDGIRPNTVLAGNVFRDDNNNYGQIYLDFWTSGVTVENNVAYDSVSLDYNTIDAANQPCCNILRYNFFDQDNSFKYQTASDMVIGTYVVPPNVMPASIIKNAGLEPAYQDLLPPVTPPSDTQAPSAPGSFGTGSLGSGPSVTVSWSSSSDNAGVTGYEIDNGSKVLAVTNGATTSATIVGLRPGASYDLVVRARDAAGNLSAPSNRVIVKVPGSPDLAGHWTFDNTSADFSGSANNGTASNTSWVGGKIGGAIGFNGSSSSVSAGNAQILNQDRNSFSVSAWFKSTSTGTHQRIVSKGNWGNTGGYMLWYNNGSIAFSLGSNGVQGNTALVGTPGGFGDGNWHQVTAVVDRPGKSIMIYIDGVARTLTSASGYCGTASGTSVSIAACPYLAGSSNDPFTIGSYKGIAEFFAGSLDDVRIYSRAVSAADILDTMSLTGRWKLDEGSGTATTDAANNSAAGTVSGASWISGKIGGGLSFNGTSNYATMGNAGALNMGTGSFSVTTWFKSTSTASHRRMVTKGNWGNTSGYFLWYEGGAVSFGLGSNGVQANTALVVTPGGFGDGNWHQATAVVDRTGNTIKIYIDGVAQTLSSASGYCGTANGTSVSIAGCSALNGSSGDPFTLGSYNGTNEFFAGSLDDVRVYNRALSAADAANLFNSTGLLGQWKFEEGRGDIATDASGNSAAGLLSGADWAGGKFGGGLSFNGTNNYATMGSAGALNMGTGSFSVTAWFKSTSTATHRRMVTKGNWGNTSGYFLWYEGGAVSFGLGSNGVQANTALVVTPGGFGDGNWHQATAVVDRTGNTIRIYIDGVAQTLSSASGYCGTANGTSVSIAGCSALNGSSGDPFTLGSYNGTNEFFRGSLDDVRIYSRALTQADVNSILLGN